MCDSHPPASSILSASSCNHNNDDTEPTRRSPSLVFTARSSSSAEWATPAGGSPLCGSITQPSVALTESNDGVHSLPEISYTSFPRPPQLTDRRDNHDFCAGTCAFLDCHCSHYIPIIDHHTSSAQPASSNIGSEHLSTYYRPKFSVESYFTYDLEYGDSSIHSIRSQPSVSAESYHTLSLPRATDGGRLQVQGPSQIHSPSLQLQPVLSSLPKCVRRSGQKAACESQSQIFTQISACEMAFRSGFPSRSPPQSPSSTGDRAYDPNIRFALNQLAREPALVHLPQSEPGFVHHPESLGPRSIGDIYRIDGGDNLPKEHSITHSIPSSFQNTRPAPNLASEHTTPQPVTHDQGRMNDISDEENGKSMKSRLSYLPFPLRTKTLSPLIAYVILMLTLLLVSGVKSVPSKMRGSRYLVDGETLPGLDTYRSFGDARYFTYRYLPVMLALINVVWLMQLDSAITRICPFIALSNRSVKGRAAAPFLPIAATQFLFPTRAWKLVKNADLPLYGVCLFIFWLQIFSIPLVATSFNVRLFQSTTSESSTLTWRWIGVHGPLWTVFILLLAELMAVVALLINFTRPSFVSGLRWDPRSIGDLIPLLSNANFLHAYVGTDQLSSKNIRSRVVGQHTLRIGWRTPDDDASQSVYGIYNPVNSVSLVREEISLPLRPVRSTSRRSGGFSYLPFPLRPVVLGFGSMTLVGMVIAFFVFSCRTDGGLIKFRPSVVVRANDGNFSAANFLYTFIPVSVAVICVFAFQAVDLELRALAPYWELLAMSDSPQLGSPADRSILVDYVHSSSITSVLSALQNRHHLSCWISLVSILNFLIPVLVSGLLWSLSFGGPDLTYLVAHKPAVQALWVFLTVAALACLSSFMYILYLRSQPSLDVAHRPSNLADIISWLYVSPILKGYDFKQVETRQQMLDILRGSGVTNAANSPQKSSMLYGFGYHNEALNYELTKAAAFNLEHGHQVKKSASGECLLEVYPRHRLLRSQSSKELTIERAC